jgi:hypothetical protein
MQKLTIWLKRGGGGTCALTAALFALVAAVAAAGTPSPKGTQHLVTSVDDLLQAINTAQDGDTIILDGTRDTQGDPVPGVVKQYVLPAAITLGNTMTFPVLGNPMPIQIPSSLKIEGSSDFDPHLIELVGPTSGEPCFRLDGAAQKLQLEGLALAGQRGIVLTSATASADVARCFFRQMNEGISCQGGAAVFVAGSVFWENQTGVKVNVGTADILQNTFINPGTACIQVDAGIANVYANLMYSDSGGVGVNGAAGIQVQLAGNRRHNITNNVVTAVTLAPDNDTYDPAPAPSFVDLGNYPTVWPGKLNTAELAAIGPIGTLLDNVYQERVRLDFEAEPRAVFPAPQAGADEVGSAGANTIFWELLEITPTVAGLNTTINFRIKVLRCSGTVTLYLVPQPGTDNNSNNTGGDKTDPNRRIPLSVTLGSGGYGNVTYTIGSDRIPVPNAPATERMILDGRALIMLECGGSTSPILLDPTDSSDVRISPQVRSTAQNLIIDTQPPVFEPFNPNQCVRAHELVVASNDFILAPSDTYPSSWMPQSGFVPSTLPSVTPSTEAVFCNTASRSAVFFNVVPVDTNGNLMPLDFTLRHRYADKPHPEKIQAEPSGFFTDNNGLLTLNAATDAELETVLRDGPDANRPGFIRWQEPIPVGDMLHNASLVVTYTSGTAMNVTDKQVEAAWSFSGVRYYVNENTWTVKMRSVATDLAGNQATSREVSLYWLTRAQALMEPKYLGQEVETPDFIWSINNSAPADNVTGTAAVSASYPLVRYKVWRALDPDNPYGFYEPLMDWSPWLPYGTGINVFAPADGNNPPTLLGDVINAAVQNVVGGPGSRVLLMITLLGADQAGNLQPTGAWDVSPNSSVQYGDIPTTVARDWWTVVGAVGTLDTQLEVQIWHETSNENDPNYHYPPQPDDYERNFGASARVPLPAKEGEGEGEGEGEEGERVVAEFTIHPFATVNTNEEIAAYWEWYIGSTLVAQGCVKCRSEDPNSNCTEFKIRFPDDFRVPDSLAREYYIGVLPLGIGKKLAEYLGDTKNKKNKQDVTYTFKVYTVVSSESIPSDNNPCGVVVRQDNTPASFTFTVFPSESEFEREQPVRSFTRE